MADAGVKDEAITPIVKEIPVAFSKCAKCSISYHESSNPVESVLLVCLHSFCRNCINNGCLKSDKGDPNLVTCCKCRCNSNRADCGINLLADSDIRVVESHNGNIKCSSCNDQTVATSNCTSCNEMLCDACVSAHKRVKLTRDHPIVPLKLNATNGVAHGHPPSTKVNKRYSCAKHSTEKLQFYCEMCNKVTCARCHEATAEHFNHPNTEVNLASVSFRNNLKLQLDNLNEKEKTVGRALDIVNEKLADLDQAEAKALSDVKEYYGTCMEALRVRMNGLGSEIKKLAAGKRLTLEKNKEDVNHLHDRLDETIQAVGYVARSGDAIAILSVKKGMAHHMSTLLKLKCQVPNPSHKTHIELQTEPSLISLVIPTTGGIVSDGVLNSQTVTVNLPSQAPTQRPQYTSNLPNSYQTAMSNGQRPSLHPALHSALTNTSNGPLKQHANPASPLQRLGQMTVHHRFMGSSPLQSQHPILYNHVNQGSTPPPLVPGIRPPAPAPGGQGYHHTTASALSHPGMPVTGTPRLPSNVNNKLPSPPTNPNIHRNRKAGFDSLKSKYTATTNDRMNQKVFSAAYSHPLITPQVLSNGVSAAGMLRQAAVTAFKDNCQSSRSDLRLNLKLAGSDPLNVNGLEDSTSSQDDSNKPLESLKISSVMSLADGSPTNNGCSDITNGRTTPTRDHNNFVAKKRKKEPLNLYHISSQHAPDDPNEDYCAVCHNGGELICCDTCPKVYHANCHVPELTGAPSSFSCSLCWDESPPHLSPEIAGPLGSASKRKAPSGLSDYEVKICEKILLRMFCHHKSPAFHLPVPKAVKHYSTYIKNPMDFTSIRKKLMRQHFNHYDSIADFIKDMRLVFSNCVAFNGPLSDYTESARIVQQFFVDQIEKYFSEHKELANSILSTEDVLNIHLIKKRAPNEDAPVVHIS